MLSLTALVLWLVTAVLGISELLAWRSSTSKPPPLAYRHAATALTGLAQAGGQAERRVGPEPELTRVVA